MPDITASAAQVGETLIQALQTALGLGPEAALAQAQADNGVTSEDIDSADMGEVFDYVCGQPDLSPDLHSYLTNAQNSYGNGNTVYQGGNSYTGGSSSAGGGGSHGGGSYGGGESFAAASNTQYVTQITQSYYTQEIHDESSDTFFTGTFNGDIDVDNDHVNVDGDGNAVNTGEGDQNAATGDQAQVIDGDNFGQANTGNEASQAASVFGDAQSNSGDGAVLAGDDIEAPVNTGVNTGVIADGDVEDTVVGNDNETANVDGNADGTVFNFGEGEVNNASNNVIDDGAVAAGGDATNVSNNDASQGGAVSGTGDATGSFTDDNSDDDLIDDKDGFDDKDGVDIDDQDLIDDKDFKDDKDLFDDKDVADVDVNVTATEEDEEATSRLLARELPEAPPAEEESEELALEG
jgi:hypothetical protein